MKKLLRFSLCCLVFFSLKVAAQDRTVTGKVTAAEDKMPIPGVTVKVVGGTKATQTDADGMFSIKVPPGSTQLEFSFLGYTNRILTIGDGMMNVVLSQDTKQLNEVVVSALGISRSQKSLGYGASVLKSDDLTDVRSSNILNSIAGKAAGVRVNSQSGTLGGSTKIVIRGVNSLDGNDVLFIVDGMPISNNTSAGGTTTNNVDYGNRAGDLSPDDIESMTILKGAAATALYGSRAKDGAVIITTKRGNKNTSSITVNSSSTFSSPLVLPKFQNEYAQGNEGVYNLKYVNGWGPKIADVQNQTFADFTGDQVTLQAYPNNVKDFFQTGSSYTNNIAFAGGGDNSDYRLSFSALNERGIIPESKLSRYDFSMNSGRQLGKNLSSRFIGNYSRTSVEGRPSQSSNNSNVLTSSIFGLPRVVDIQKLKDNFIDPATGGQRFLSTDKNGNNPFWIINFNKNNNKVDRFYGTYTLEYKPLSWVTLANNFGTDIYTEKRSSFTRKGTAGFLQGAFNNVDIFSRQINNDFLVTLEQDNLVKDFKFKLLLGNNINDREIQSSTVDAVDLTIDQLYNYTNAGTKNPVLAYSQRRLIGAFGDLGISYRDLLYINVTGRNDWSSTLPKNNNSYFYPSVSGSFVFSELLMGKKGFGWLNYGKLRASFASVGSDLAPYNLDYQFAPASTVFIQYSLPGAIFPFGNITTAFAGPTTLPNSNLVPQKSNSYEFGTEFKLLDNRLGVDFNYYTTTTTNQLIPIAVPVSTGYSRKFVNVGSIRNRGMEASLNLVPVKIKNFTWDIDLNFAKNRQIVAELTTGVNDYVLSSGWSGLQIKAAVGQPFGLYGTKFERSPSGEYVINANSGLKEVVKSQRLGNLYPDWTLGVSNTFTYKRFSLSGVVDFRQGGVFYSGTVANLRSLGLAIETGGDRAPFVDKGVIKTQNGDYIPNTVPVQSYQKYWSNQAATANTEGNVFDASFVKLRELKFSYDFPKSLFKENSPIKSAQIGIEGRNLWLIRSHVPHVDPELNFFGAGVVGEGVEFNSVPSTKSVGFNLRLTF